MPVDAHYDLSEGCARVIEAKNMCGVLGGPAFIVTFTALGARREGYDWRRHVVSSLADGSEGMP